MNFKISKHMKAAIRKITVVAMAALLLVPSMLGYIRK